MHVRIRVVVHSCVEENVVNVQSDSLGQPHAVIGSVKDTVILPDEDSPQDPQWGIIAPLEATVAEVLVLGKTRLR